MAGQPPIPFLANLSSPCQPAPYHHAIISYIDNADREGDNFSKYTAVGVMTKYRLKLLVNCSSPDKR
ncbi:hypothetical protein HPB52_019794 [Rhipicephalus sanguineus]|uniref:Uncharacterized protein n=1 Tax=Rhipicephalus sanguineus TaxID=34632 RepID=A0A9D4SNS9_RHISA|nr:hypothetical protein HPB52_019794 [Rhipicephalus sanguineus]